MRGKTILSGVAVLVINLIAVGYANVADASGGANHAFNSDAVRQDDLPVRKETRQTFQLSPNALIEVSGIEGRVDVETTTGATAEMIFLREARTQVDFDCEGIVVEHAPNKLVIRHETKKEPQCRIIMARERMTLRVPRSASLNFSNIEGGFTAGATEGLVQLRNIEGSVRIEQARAVNISSAEGSVSLNVSEITSPGINISNVEGGVDIGVRKDLNANLLIKALNVHIDLPTSQAKLLSRRNHQLQLGRGGENISISNIEGGVKIRGI